jgi:hypothetical protein
MLWIRIRSDFWDPFSGSDLCYIKICIIFACLYFKVLLNSNPDPTFHFNADPYRDLIQILHNGKSEFFFFWLSFTAAPLTFFQYFGQCTENFWNG